jgi:hypothetical protein
MTTLSRGSRHDAEAPVRTAAHVAAPAPTGTAASAVPWAGPATPAGAARASAARLPRAAKNVITTPMAARRRAAPLTWNLTQATDSDLAQATDWDLRQATGRNLRQAELTPS